MLTIQRRDDRYHLSGFIDAEADFSPLAQASGAVHLNLSQIAGINSVGVKIFSDFMNERQDRRFHIHECAHVMLDAFVMVPSLLGPIDCTAVIESFFIFYQCRKCDRDLPMPVSSGAVKVSHGELVFPAKKCPACEQMLVPDDAAQDLNLLIEQKAIQIP